jgi:hypothetical protein
MASKADHRTLVMTSPYLDRPLLPIAVVLPRLLENIEAELTGRKLEVAEERWLQERAGLIRELLAPSPIT